MTLIPCDECGKKKQKTGGCFSIVSLFWRVVESRTIQSNIIFKMYQSMNRENNLDTFLKSYVNSINQSLNLSIFK